MKTALRISFRVILFGAFLIRFSVLVFLLRVLHVCVRGTAADGNPRARQGGFTALLRAASNGHTDCVRSLIERGADKEAKTSVRFVMQ
jgi:hypothetical protein